MNDETGTTQPITLTDYGIRAISYKHEDTLRTVNPSNAKEGVYFITSEIHEASQLWCP